RKTQFRGKTISLDCPPHESEGEKIHDVRLSPEELLLDTEKKIAIQKAINELPPILRTVAALRFLEGYSMNQIAETLGITTNTAKARVFRAKNRIGTSLRKEYFAPRSSPESIQGDA